MGKKREAELQRRITALLTERENGHRRKQHNMVTAMSDIQSHPFTIVTISGRVLMGRAINVNVARDPSGLIDTSAQVRFEGENSVWY